VTSATATCTHPSTTTSHVNTPHGPAIYTQCTNNACNHLVSAEYATNQRR